MSTYLDVVGSTHFFTRLVPIMCQIPTPININAINVTISIILLICCALAASSASLEPAGLLLYTDPNINIIKIIDTSTISIVPDSCIPLAISTHWGLNIIRPIPAVDIINYLRITTTW
ncbi:hypothetical protein CcNV_100 [Crangon crangon nudivirus]|uniref:Uncharacterized protein n=1 Tax=Crangon crangon nudivirus TaxID=2880838 RepID=A0AAE8Y515_9VIRU|nr:hypothetical protein QKT25_gp101 [Crangon crangon nudivirus]UBZ25585.1 hypothetical protein CcNV_100 [Crangon crangon nudivirus]